MRKLMLVCSAAVALAARAEKIVVTDSYDIDSQEKIDAVRASDGLEIQSGATATYSDAANPLFLNVPVTGAGTFVASGGKRLVLEADSRDFTGSWNVTDTFTAVSNRYGLGSSKTSVAKFSRSSDSTYLFMLWFGGDGLTNDVPLQLMTGGTWPLKENVTELRDKTKVAVFNGKITKQVALRLSCYPAIYAGGTASNGGSLSVGAINSGTDGNAKGMNGQWARFTKPILDGAGNVSFDGGNNAVIDYHLDVAGSTFDAQLSLSRGRIFCGVENAIKSGNYSGKNPTSYKILLGGKYDSEQWHTAVIDMQGHNQLCSLVKCNWTVEEGDSTAYKTQVTSTGGPATLTMTYGDSCTTATRFEGEASLEWRGTGTYALARQVSTSTGDILVRTGAVALKWGAGWAGNAIVTNDGAKLVVSSAMGFTNGKSKVLVAGGGRVEVAAGGVAKVGELAIGADGVLDIAAGATVTATNLTVNGRTIPVGTYSSAGFAAEGLGDFVTGDGQISVGTAAQVRGTNPFDYLVFDLHLPATTDQATAADLRDAVTHSASSPLRPTTVVTYDPSQDATGYASFGSPAPVSIAERTVPVAYYRGHDVTCKKNVLVLPKNVGTDANGVTAAYATPVYWAKLPKLSGSNISVRVRYRWQGNYKQGDNWAWDQYLFHLVNFDNQKSICNGTFESIYPTQDKTSVLMRGGVGGDIASGGSVSLGGGGASASKDVWYDTVWTFSNKAGGGSVIRTYLTGGTSSDVSCHSLGCASSVVCPTSGNGAIVLGGQYGHFSLYGAATGNKVWRKLMTDNQPYVYSGFVGEIAEFQIFDKAFSCEEANAILMGDAAGATMRVGTLNGSADEFAATGDAAIVPDFNAATNAPTQFRKTLDAENPSVTVTVPLHPEESGLARYLTLGVLREDVMSAPIEVRFNGQLAETLTFSDDSVKTFFVRPRFLRTDANTNVVLTLTRPGNVSGKVHIDAIRLSGGWATGVLDGKNTDWCFDPKTTYQSVASFDTLRCGVIGGARNLPVFLDEIWGTKNEGDFSTVYYPVQSIAFDLPAAALDARVKVTFELGIASMGGDAELDVWCNGGTAVAHLGPGASCRKKIFAIDIPPANRRAGLNVIKVGNVGQTFSTGQQYNSVSFDCFRLKVRQTADSGCAIILR